MPWWLWILVGLGLLIVEVAVPGGIILLFFGVAAVILGGLVLAGWGGPTWFQLTLFSTLSIVSLFTLRGPIFRRIKATSTGSDKIDSLVGEPIILLEDLSPGAEGKAELRGTSWIAKNVSTQSFLKGDRCVVEAVRGLKLHVGPQQ